jgi:hypothetical protein
VFDLYDGTYILFPSKQHLATILHLPTPQIVEPSPLNLIPNPPPRILLLLQRKHFLNLTFHTTRRGIVIFIQIHLSQHQHILTPHEVCTTFDVCEEVLWLTTAFCSRGPCSEVAFNRRGEDEVGELVPGAEDAEDLAAVAEDEEEFFYWGL